MTNILNWFRHNSMKANPDEFQFMIVELVGLTIDHKLNLVLT